MERLDFQDEWLFPVNVAAREKREKEECELVRVSIEQYEKNIRMMEEEKYLSTKRNTDRRLSRSGSATAEELARMSSGVYEIQGSPQMKRKRLVGQLKGNVTWEINGAETGYQRMLDEERETLLRARKESKLERRKQAPDAKSAALDDLLANDHIDPKVEAYVIASVQRRSEVGSCGQIPIVAESNTAQMPYDELAMNLEKRSKFRKNLNLPQIYTIPPMHLPPDEEGNWMLNSNNRQRILYPALYDEKDRMDAKEAKKIAMKNLMENIATKSDFLKEEFEREQREEEEENVRRRKKKQAEEEKKSEKMRRKAFKLEQESFRKKRKGGLLSTSSDVEEKGEIKPHDEVWIYEDDQGVDIEEKERKEDDQEEDRNKEGGGKEVEKVEEVVVEEEEVAEKEVMVAEDEEIKWRRSTRRIENAPERSSSGSSLVEESNMPQHSEHSEQNVVSRKKKWDGAVGKMIVVEGNYFDKNSTTTAAARTKSRQLRPSRILDQKKLERKLQRQSRQRLYGSSSAPDLETTMQFNRDQRLIDGPSVAENIMSSMEGSE